MASYDKFDINAIGHLCKHFERNICIKEYSNQEIEKERSCENYNLAPEREGITQLEFIHNRLREVSHLNRADLKVMTTWCVTAPKDLEQSQMKDFFKETYNFLIEKYGEENVISAYVHMDETTPHMHFAFVPVVLKNGGFRISAKECTTKKDLMSFHSKYQEYLNSKEINATVYSGITAGNNLSIRELKQQTKKEILKEQKVEREWGGNQKGWGNRAKGWEPYER